MNYEVSILRRAQRQLAAFDRTIRSRIQPVLISLSENPRPPGSRKLSGRDGWRIRIGDYRVIYEINDEALTITVLDIGHRKDIYR
ncbi:MAG: type II toxin-antitoxin system RelE/ParE family toxin [Leptospiraceae bacterium]|nr:type II toxin-antitoxin system RelE/ParE family toxin [Leptospiraceae bacterium]MCB1322205.1 type II toxin-antitoxin system RelE/ParE family toxin [Leptospiraceae bacterium]